MPRIYNNTAGNLGIVHYHMSMRRTDKGLVTYEDPLSRKIVEEPEMSLWPLVVLCWVRRSQSTYRGSLGDSWSARGRGGSRPSTEASDSRPGRYRQSAALAP